jgi:peroxiredoxin
MIKIGDMLPDITLRSVADDGTQNFNFYKKFINRNILIICVPGAFTSTCHIKHLPPFIKGAEKLMSEKKLDYICCITTNDPYVLDLWRKDLGGSKIIFLSDGNLEFLNTSQLIRNHEKSFMGNRLIRSIIIADNLKVTNIIFDKPGELNKTSFESVLKTI